MDTFQRYVASPVILSAAQFFFDKMVYSFTYQQALYDSILTLGSLLGSKIVTNIFVAKTVGVLDNYYASNFISYLAEPLLNYIAYNYLYKEQFKKNYISKEKGDLALMLMPIFQSIAGMFLDKTLTLPSAQTSIAVNVYIFNYQMSHIANKQVVFLDQ
ncbi:hypothetical protein ABPG72_005893 [Tetrahymena utriculariae]